MTDIKKVCNDCGVEFDIENFYIQNHKRKSKSKGEYVVKYVSAYCKTCDKARTSGVYDKNKDRINAKRRDRLNDPIKKAAINKAKKDSYLNNPIPYILSRARQRAKNSGLEFNLDTTDVVIPDMCPLLNIPFEFGSKGNYSSSPSLDRKDPSKGYIKGNVWIVTMKANTMKSDASREQLLTFAQSIIKHFKEDIVRTV